MTKDGDPEWHGLYFSTYSGFIFHFCCILRSGGTSPLGLAAPDVLLWSDVIVLHFLRDFIIVFVAPGSSVTKDEKEPRSAIVTMDITTFVPKSVGAAWPRKSEFVSAVDDEFSSHFS